MRTSKEGVELLLSKETDRRIFLYSPLQWSTFTEENASFTALVARLLLSVSRASITSTRLVVFPGLSTNFSVKTVCKFFLLFLQQSLFRLERFAAGSNFEGLIWCFLLFLGVLEASMLQAHYLLLGNLRKNNINDVTSFQVILQGVVSTPPPPPPHVK